MKEAEEICKYMKTLENYLDDFKKRLNIESDYELAKELKITRQQISKIRSGANSIGREKCVRIANGLKIDPMEVIAWIEASKEKNAEIRALWVKLAREKAKAHPQKRERIDSDETVITKDLPNFIPQ